MKVSICFICSLVSMLSLALAFERPLSSRHLIEHTSQARISLRTSASAPYSPKLAVVLVVATITSVSASARGNEPCKVLTAERFSQIMGYEATVIQTSSNQTSCFYQGG